MKVLLAAIVLFLSGPATAQQPEPPMTVERLTTIVLALDPDAEIAGPTMRLTVEDVPVVIVTDAAADRMRALVPIRSVAGMEEGELLRVMQANFDTALDARYAVAQGRLWAAFIHPLGPLERDEFLSGLGQTVNLALTYGSFYTGGALSFGGGDSGLLHRELIERLLKKGQEI